MAISRRFRPPKATFPIRPKVKTPISNEQALNQCPYPAESGCFYLWCWGFVVSDFAKRQDFKPSVDDGMIYYPSDTTTESLNEYRDADFKQAVLAAKIQNALEVVETMHNEWKKSESTKNAAMYHQALVVLSELVFNVANEIALSLDLIGETITAERTISKQDLAKMIGKKDSAINAHMKKGLKPLNPGGKPLVFDFEHAREFYKKEGINLQ